MSNTPISDAAKQKMISRMDVVSPYSNIPEIEYTSAEYVPIHVSQQLERELNEADSAYNRLQKESNEWQKCADGLARMLEDQLVHMRDFEQKKAVLRVYYQLKHPNEN